jgi:hypothetical protein
MKVAFILGGGESLTDYRAEYVPKDGRVLACNSTEAEGITDVVCADRYAFVKSERAGALRDDVPIHVLEVWGDWQAVASKRKNIKIHSTRNWGGQDKESPIKNLWKGVHTPFFAACLALHEGAEELHFFGVDCTNHQDGTQRSIIREFNYLAKWATVYVPENSALWAIAEKHGMKLEGVQSVAYPLPLVSQGEPAPILDVLDGDGIDGYDFPPDYGNEPVTPEPKKKRKGSAENS